MYEYFTGGLNHYVGYVFLIFFSVMFVLTVSSLFFCRWGRGFGLVQFFVAKDSPLNQPNSVLGIIFYTLQMGLG